MGYCYMKLFYYDEAYKCFSYGLELAPYASDCYLRRSQVLMYNKDSDMEDLKQAVNDVNRAIEKRPKDKFYKAQKEELERVI